MESVRIESMSVALPEGAVRVLLSSRRVHGWKTAGTLGPVIVIGMETSIIEIGTDRARLLSATFDSVGRLATRTLRVTELGLGASIDEVGGIARIAGAEAVAKIGRLVDFARAACPSHELRGIAIDGLGFASNATVFARAIERRHDFPVTLLSPRETIRLAYGGARAERRSLSGQAIVAHLGDSALDLASGTRGTLDLEATVPLGVERVLRAYESGFEALLPEDAGPLFSLARLSAGPAAKRLRTWGADSFIVASENVSAFRAAAAAFGFLDTRTDSIDRLSLHAFVGEALNATLADYARAGIAREWARRVGVTAVLVDALSDLLGAREVLLASNGPAEGAALDLMARPQARLAAGAESLGRY